jgi:MFS transporter, ACS family, D-galactonate transporter
VLVGDTRLVIAFFALSQAALGMCEGVFWTAAPSVERRNAGLACALMNTGGNAAGMVAPTLTPILGQAFGWTTAIAVACALCAVGGLLWLGVRSGEEAPAGGSEGIQAVL